MARIHGFVWIVLGILMSLYARFIQNKVQKSSLSLFFWIGLGFIAFGVFRLILDYVFSDSSKKVKPVANPALERLKAEREKMLQKPDINKEHSYDNLGRVIVACSRCGTKHYSNSKFCHMCGFQLK